MILDQTCFLKSPGQFFPEADDFMWIVPAQNFLVTTATLALNPRKTLSVPVHFIEAAAGLIHVRLPTSDVWLTHACRKTPDGLWWTIKDIDYFWAYVPAEQVPAWAHPIFAKGVALIEQSKNKKFTH